MKYNVMGHAWVTEDVKVANLWLSVSSELCIKRSFQLGPGIVECIFYISFSCCLSQICFLINVFALYFRNRMLLWSFLNFK